MLLKMPEFICAVAPSSHQNLTHNSAHYNYFLTLSVSRVAITGCELPSCRPRSRGNSRIP
jgi:hypothetical protein